MARGIPHLQSVSRPSCSMDRIWLLLLLLSLDSAGFAIEVRSPGMGQRGCGCEAVFAGDTSAAPIVTISREVVQCSARRGLCLPNCLQGRYLNFQTVEEVTRSKRSGSGCQKWLNGDAEPVVGLRV